MLNHGVHVPTEMMQATPVTTQREIQTALAELADWVDWVSKNKCNGTYSLPHHDCCNNQNSSHIALTRLLIQDSLSV